MLPVNGAFEMAKNRAHTPQKMKFPRATRPTR